MKTAIFLADGFEEIEAVAIIDILRRGGQTVDLISVAGVLDVRGSHDILVHCDLNFYDIEYDSYEMLILPGGPGVKNLGEKEELCNLLLEFDKQEKYIGAICAAPSILGELGILNGRIATCYPGFESRLRGCKFVEDDVVKCDHIITGSGPGTAMKFALKILELNRPLSEVEELRRGLLLK